MNDVLSTTIHHAPTTDLEPGERFLSRFRADPGTYWRENAALAAIAMALGMGALWAIGNPHVWTGAVGGLAAVAVRAFYLSSDETRMEWHLTDRRLLGPGSRTIALDDMEHVRRLFSAVQIITLAGDKHLLKYQGDTDAVVAMIDAARTAPGVR